MGKAKALAQNHAQLIIPLLALFALVAFNMIRDPGFFSVGFTQNSDGNTVLTGNLISIFNSASELAILAMGMTLVTAASRGQDISVGANAAIAGSIFVSFLLTGQMTWGAIIAAFLASCAAAMMVGAFNGALVSVFKIQPMIATLIMFTIGRSIAYWINGGATPTLPAGHPTLFLGRFIPGIPIPAPVFIVVFYALIFAIVLKLTNLGLYAQAVGINEKAARLNGIDPVRMKLLTFMILGLCVAAAAVIRVGRLALINHETILLGIEMDAILAVAIGGNSLGGGKFNMIGSVIGAYVIQGLTTTLLAMNVASTDVQAYKAVVIIAIVAIGSPVVKQYAGGFVSRLFNKQRAPAIRGGV